MIRLIRSPMPAIRRRLATLPHDECGGEILEYVFIAGLIIVVCIAAVAGVGTKVLARWNTVGNASL